MDKGSPIIWLVGGSDDFLGGAMTFAVAFDVEIHCDYCMEPSHFHFDKECPVCHAEHAGTNQYCSVLECIKEGGVFECQECKTKFKILSYQYADDPEALIEVINAQPTL